ncbi:hypothetical protein BX666DRAFT_1971615 [Dichotomocladium elegans]|nr:hypothetical protein BX666DRAFT_1971615 [Dichotomocladium elegans]
MSLEIPGYYFDPEKNRYFRIQANGPHSREAVRSAQRIARLEKEQATLSRNPLQYLRDRNVVHYLYDRQLQGSRGGNSRKRIDACHRALFRQMRPTRELDIRQSYRCDGLVEFCEGEAFVSYGSRMVLRYGYQCNPFFQMWETSMMWETCGHIAALKAGYEHEVEGQRARQFVFISNHSGRDISGGELSRFSVSAIPEIQDEQTAKAIRSAGSTRNVMYSVPTGDRIFLQYQFLRKTMAFHAVDCSIEHGGIALGGEKGAYLLSDDFNTRSVYQTKSDVLAIKYTGRHKAWLGCRDGHLLLMDERSPKPDMIIAASEFATARLATLQNDHLISVDVQKSVNIWDVRYVQRRYPWKKKLQQPLRRLRGHDESVAKQRFAFDVNSSARILALADTDQRVCFWSLGSSASDNMPFWTTEKQNLGTIRAVNFMEKQPQMARVWQEESMLDPGRDSLSNAPGMVITTDNQHQPGTTFHWLTIPQ